MHAQAAFVFVLTSCKGNIARSCPVLLRTNILFQNANTAPARRLIGKLVGGWVRNVGYHTAVMALYPHNVYSTAVCRFVPTVSSLDAHPLVRFAFNGLQEALLCAPCSAQYRPCTKRDFSIWYISAKKVEFSQGSP